MKKVFSIIISCLFILLLTACTKQERKFVRIGDLNFARAGHQAIILRNGKILILGGYTRNYDIVKEIEIYNPTTKKFSLVNKRLDNGFNNALLLRNGNVAIFYNNGVVIYDPIKNKFNSLKKMLIPRTNFSCILLNNGKILIKGGLTNTKNQIPVTISEVYDPITSSFKYVNNDLIKNYYEEPYYLKIIHNKNKMHILRTNFLSIPLYNGKILIVGGFDKHGKYVFKSEIFNVKTKQFDFTGNMNFCFTEYYSANYLYPVNSENILLTGKDINHYKTMNAEFYNINSGKFTQIKNKIFDRLYPSVNCIKNNTYLITGGSKQNYTEDDFIKPYKDAYILNF